MTISSTQSDFLNLACWLAALLVVAEHARSLMFQDYGTSGASGIPAKACDRLLVGLTFELLLNSLESRFFRLPSNRLSGWLADFSYTTYLAHFPLLVFGLSLFQEWNGRALRQPFSFGFIHWYRLAILLVLSFSWGISRITEAKTSQFRILLYRWTGQSRPGFSPTAPQS